MRRNPASISSSSLIFLHRFNDANSAATTANIVCTSRGVIVTSYVNAALEQAATTAGYESQMWVDDKTLKKQFSHKHGIRPRNGEVPTIVIVQQRHALFNLEQLRAGPKGVEFAKHLPKGIAEPMDAAALQPFRGALAQQLEQVARNSRWGPYWLSSTELKWRGFFQIGSTFAPPAWRTTTSTFHAWNFMQLASEGGADLATVPVNYRFSNLMLGTDVSEQLRNEALRRGLRYPVIATNKMVELTGCTLLPDRISGFRISRNEARANEFLSSTLIYNIADFDCGANHIEKTMNLPHVTQPTFAFSGVAITRQLILQDDSSNNAHENADEVVVGAAVKATAATANPKLNQIAYKSNYWMREFEARQLSDGRWKLKPGARGASLGDTLVEQRDGETALGGSAVDDVTASSNANSNRIVAAKPGNYRNSSNTDFMNMTYLDAGQIYYFSEDVKERKEFLKNLGTYFF